MSKTKFHLEVFLFFPVFIASILALFLYPLQAEARIKQTPSSGRTCWSANLINSAFGKYYSENRPGENPPVYYYSDCTTGGADIDDKSATTPYSFQGAGSSRNLATYRNYISIPTTTGINYTTYTGIGDDSYGFEDTTLKYAVCDGTYPDDSSIFTHNCLKGQIYFNSFGSGPPWPKEGDGDSVVPYPPAIKIGFPDNLGPDAYRKYATDWLYESGQSHISTSSDSRDGYNSTWLNLNFKKIAIASCSSRNICVDGKYMASRTANCDYLTPVSCDGVCINGTCDPATLPPANVTTAPISPVTASNPLDKINITTAGGLLQCKYKRDYGHNDTIWYGETYYVDEKYTIDAVVPTSAKYIMAWIAPDLNSSTEANQRPYYFNKRYDVSTSYTNSFSTFNTSTRIFNLAIFPTEHDRTDFWDEATSKKAQYGAFGRGDSFVLQMQTNKAASNENPWWRNIKDDEYTPRAEAPAPITLPEYYHYTMPSYAQCAGPGEVTPTVASSTLSCSSNTNRISWSPVAGADQYLVLVRKTSGPVSLYDGYSLVYGDFMATTTATYYDYTVPYPRYYADYKVKVYAHNANGWNISNTTASFNVYPDCGCTTSAGATSTPNTDKNYYLSTTSSTSCTPYRRTCDGSTGVLNGNTSAIYGSCTVTYPNCTGPDGTVLAPGQEKTYYRSTVAPCESQSRRCSPTSGILSGDPSYQYASCQSTPPTTPTGVSVVAQSYCGGGNDVSWNLASGVFGYRVYRSTSLNGTYSELTGPDGTLSVPFTDTLTNPSTTYYYKVSSFNSYGSSTQSSAVSATTPDVCSETGSIEISRFSTDLSTIANTPAGTRGKIDSLSSISANPAIYTEVSEGNHTAYATDLPGYVEKFGACTYSMGDPECSVDSDQFTTASTCSGGYCSTPTYVSVGQVTKVAVMYVDPPENPPENLYASTGASCGRLIDLSWDPVETATGYRLYRSTTLGGAYSEITDSNYGTQDLLYTDVAPNPETKYYYKVAAFNEAGTSPRSTAVFATSTETCVHVGTIEITRYGTNLSTPTSAPAGTQGKVDALQATTSNPAMFENLEAEANYGAKVTNIPGYSVKMATCTYNIGDLECNISGDQFSDVNCDTDYCLRSVYVPENVVTKVAAMYTSQMGSIQVSHYGNNLSTWPSPDLPTNLFSKVDSTTTLPLLDNPQNYDNLINDLHTVYVPDITDTYDITYGECSYSGVAECAIEASQFYTTPDCDGTYCALDNIQVDTNLIKKVGVRYIEKTSSIPAPVISGPTVGAPNINYTYTAVSGASTLGAIKRSNQTAQVSDALLAQAVPQLRYGFDWDHNYSVDEWQPEVGYTDLGVSVSSTHMWTASRVYPFQVKAVDDRGASSNWSEYTMTIGDPCTSPQTGYKPVCSCNNGLNPNDPVKMDPFTEAPYCSCQTSNARYQSGDSCVTCPSYKNFNGTTCTCPNGTADSGTACVPTLLKINTFISQPDIIYPGASSTLIFNIEGATSTCSIEGGGSTFTIPLDAVGYASSTIQTQPINNDTKFTLTCISADSLLPSFEKVTVHTNPFVKER